MHDTNWELINGASANIIEMLNATNQINVLNGLIIFLLSHRGPTKSGNPPMPDEAALRHLHYAGTLFLLSDPGQYRNHSVSLQIPDGTIIYQPPRWQDVKGLMQHFFRDLSSVWTSGDALEVAAYALWRINWIHPFPNGNGRTARAFAYACLNLRLGVHLPGSPTVIDQIMTNRAKYQEVLGIADLSLQNTGIPDLTPMREFLNELLQIQIASIDQAPQEPEA